MRRSPAIQALERLLEQQIKHSQLLAEMGESQHKQDLSYWCGRAYVSAIRAIYRAENPEPFPLEDVEYGGPSSSTKGE